MLSEGMRCHFGLNVGTFWVESHVADCTKTVLRALYVCRSGKLMSYETESLPHYNYG